MTSENEAVYLNAVPLLAVGGLYLVAAATLAPSVWRERRRIRSLDLALALVFPSLGVAAVLVGLAVLSDREPVGGSGWLAFAGILVGAIPPLVYFAHFGRRELLVTGPHRALEAEAERTRTTRRRETINRFTLELPQAGTLEALGRTLTTSACEVLAVDFASLTLIEGRRGRGVAARYDGGEVPWDDVELDLDLEPSGIASAVFEAAPVTVFDVASSPATSRRLAQRVDVRSALFAPLVLDATVVGVLALATTSPHVFTPEEIGVAQELAAEAAVAVERLRSSEALAEALERERLVGRISKRLRSELDLEPLLDGATRDAAEGLRADRAFVRLTRADGSADVLHEWRREDLPPATSAPQLAVSDLAAAERRTVAIDDLDAERAVEGREHVARLGTRSVLATPIIVLDRVVGVFTAHRTERRRWSADDVALAEAVAHEIGLALHTGRLLEENRTRLERQAALLRAAEVLTADLEFDSVLRRLVDEAVRIVGADAADCWIYDHDERTLRCRAVAGLPSSEVGRRIAPEGTLGEAIASRRPILRRRFAETEVPEPSASYREFDEAMDAPIVDGGRVRGVLGVCARAGGTFDEEDLALLEAFAHLASLALRNAEVFEERSRQARVQRGFSRIALVLSEPLSLEETLDAVATAAGEALGGAFTAVVAPARDRFVLVGGSELPPPIARTLRGGLPAEDGALADATSSGRVISAPVLARDDRFTPAFREAAAQAGASALLAIPVRHGDGGVALVLVFFEGERQLLDDDLELAQHLAGAARGSLERSQLFEEERSARSLAQQLARTASVLATELDPAAVLDEIVRQAPPLVGVDAAAIRLVEGDELVVSALHGVADADRLLGDRSGLTGRLAGEVAQSRQALALEDAGSDERLRAADPVLRSGMRAYAAVPLVAPEGGIHGVLSLYGREPKVWRRAEVEALTALAGGASTSLQNAELYQRVAIEKERSFAILANIADGIVAVDREGEVVLWNRAAEEITDVPAAEALGRTPQQVLGRRLEGDGETMPRDRLVSIVRGGDEVWLSLTEAVMRDPAGAVAGRIYAFRDISADRLVEQMKTEFVTTVSQELRRPLTSIYGFAETLLRRDINFGDEERRTFLGYIASESERLTAIVDALLNVARLDAGDLQISLAPTDVGAAVTQAVADHEHLAVADGHRFVVEVPDEPLAAEADAEKLRQVLANLFDNAVKYSPDGGTVTVAARRRGDRIEVSVADEGVGIAEGEQERIFRKFYRADATGSRAGQGGTGLGLFIVRGLVTAMGGRIWVTSREGRGASFTFELPAAAAPARTEPAAERV
ncbi:MAG: GAF domain-containing protein [Pseudomonadota bacterium]